MANANLTVCSLETDIKLVPSRTLTQTAILIKSSRGREIDVLGQKKLQCDRTIPPHPSPPALDLQLIM